ncbi:MAG: methyltransferase domain-containing protein [Xanthomonadales bacterium]|nr:23S rRNA (uracil(747)-C(5))-methyltransferase RlmC [Xanthomonadales bacterium]MCC6592861.1 methyltransferase domain-containing protein [Xanthomonadales bacterium]MCE7931175.1 23S rRNA (uracil(747)-C(5))-methyltransferase [Xanthomonadales bacterium PRO6]
MNCAHFEAWRCRSCGELAQPYERQLAAKQARAQTLLWMIDPAAWLPSCPSPEHGFRNKAKMAIGGSTIKPTLGLLDAAGHGVDLGDCALYPPGLAAVFEAVRTALVAARVPPYELASRRGEGKYVLLTQVPGSDDLLLRFVLRSREALSRLRAQLPVLRTQLPALRVASVNLLPEHKAVTEGAIEILLTDESEVHGRWGDVAFRLTPRSFLQTNTPVATALYAQARDWIARAAPARAWDLYCGVGAFALHAAAEGIAVTGVESTPEAIAAARAAHPAGDWIVADAAAWACAQPRAAELVIVNPPRRGVGAVLAEWLQRHGGRWLLYCSCHPQSLARDLAALPAYSARRARVFDMFPHTTHFETLLWLERD